MLVPGEPVPKRGGWRGTRTFLPPESLAVALGFAAADLVAKDKPGVVEPTVGDPSPELEQEPSVEGAESGVPASLDDVGVTARRVDAAESFEHDRNATPTSGRLPFGTPPPWANNDTAPSGRALFDLQLP